VLQQQGFHYRGAFQFRDPQHIRLRLVDFLCDGLANRLRNMMFVLNNHFIPFKGSPPTPAETGAEQGSDQAHVGLR